MSNLVFSKRLIGVAALVASLAASDRLAAQVELEFPILTAASDDSLAALLADGSPIAQGRSLFDHRFTVGEGQQIMIFSPSGEAVLQVLGPAELAVKVLEDDGRIDVELTSGVLMTTSPTASNAQVVRIFSPGAGNVPLFEGRVGRGWTVYSRDANAPSADIAYVGEAGAAEGLSLQVNGQAQQLTAGQRIAIRGDRTQRVMIGSWLQDNNFDFHAFQENIGLKSAVITRLTVQNELVDNLIQWDRRAESELVIASLTDDSRFQPEIRQVFAVTTRVQQTQERGGGAEPVPVAGANEVPFLSPASISVGGITAISLNESARNLVRITNSRGLGFNGLSQLAIPGSIGGIRTLGPPGLSGSGP